MPDSEHKTEYHPSKIHIIFKNPDRVVQHNRWNGKDCPKTIRTTAGAWEAFLALCGGQGSQDMDPELEAAVDTLAAAGIIDSPERWKALDFTANSVRLLLIKMGRYVTN